MKKWLSAFMMLTLVLVLAACSGDDKKEETEDAAKEDDAKTEEATTIEVTHELDKEPVVVPVNPEKVAVFDLGALDTMQELGLEDHVVGLPQATVPAYLDQFKDEKYKNFGSLKEPVFEEVHAAKPDLIIISARQADMYDEFKEIAPTVYMELDTKNYLESFETNAKLIGQMFDKEAEIDTALEEIEGKVADVKADAEKSEVEALVVLGTEGKVSAYGPASRFGLVHDVLGVTPADDKIESSRHGQSITYEYILETNPDVLYIIDRDAAIGNGASVKESIENDLVKKTNAFKNDKMIYLDGEVWYLASGGLESMNIMVDEVAEGLE